MNPQSILYKRKDFVPSAMLLCDFYKISHRAMYPDNTEIIYSTWTPRASRFAGVNQVVVAGNQMFIKRFLLDFFHNNFFSRPKKEVVAEYARIIKFTLGDPNPHTEHIEALHDLGYLPLLIKALPEGMTVPLRVPTLVIQNTKPEFFWLTNYIESLASCELWPVYTAATIAREYRKVIDTAAMRTVGNTDFVPFQGHDFSFRGMLGLEGSWHTGIGHLLSFVGTDTIPAIQASEFYYNANIEKELVGTSIAASEHSIECAYGDDEAYINRLITKVHPCGPVSIVADGYDYWNVIRNVLPKLKGTIMARKGGLIPALDKVVIRPDSGDPVKIVTGDSSSSDPLVRKGSVEALWDTFGGTITSKGYRQLDSHIGLIYGDAITLQRAQDILKRLEAKGFSAGNIVFGVGSFTYQYNTRDTFGFALKSTDCVIGGKEKMIFKDPKTDDGIKKSQKGCVAVFEKDGLITYQDGLSLNDKVGGDLLVPIFKDGELLVDESLSTIRARLLNSPKIHGLATV